MPSFEIEHTNLCPWRKTTLWFAIVRLKITLRKEKKTEENWIPMETTLKSFVVFHRSGSRTKDQKNADSSNLRAWDVARFSVDREKCEAFRWICRRAGLTNLDSLILPVISSTLDTADPLSTLTIHLSFLAIQGCLSMHQVCVQVLQCTYHKLELCNFFHSGGPMDHPGGMPMNEFGMTPDASFLNQPNGPPIAGGANPSERSGSPEFMTTNGNFSESSNINEGLVW